MVYQDLAAHFLVGNRFRLIERLKKRELLSIPQTLATRIFDAVLARIDGENKLSMVDVMIAEAVVAGVEMFYDKYIGPLNIQCIPDDYEPYFDAAMRFMIRPAVMLAFSNFLASKVGSKDRLYIGPVTPVTPLPGPQPLQPPPK